MRQAAVPAGTSPFAVWRAAPVYATLPRMSKRALPLLLSLALLLTVGATSVSAANFPAKDSRYHNYAEMVQVLMDAQAAHPDIVQVSSIGKSYQGRDIWAVKVSDNVATDENEPEVMFDSLHHAREHLSLEQSLAILRWLTAGYGTDDRITKIVNSREIWIIPSVNPDGAEFDLTGDPYREWRKSRQPNAGSTHRGTDLNRNYGYHWNCCHGSSGSTASATYHGKKAFSATETQVMRDFMLSRRVGGQQQVKLAITFHTAGEQVLWPYGYTKADVPYDMTKDDHAALVLLGKRMANRNGYTAKQSSDLYVTDGDEIDWAYGSQRIWMFTFELYPTHAKVSTVKRFYPPDEIIGRETERNKDAILYLIEHAGCRYSVIGKTTTHCGPMFDDFETANGWAANPLGTDTATSGTWQRGDPAATSWQAGTVTSGSRALVTGTAAGSAASANDLDGGVTSIRSVPVTLPATTGSLTFRYYLAHASNASDADYFRAYVEQEDGTRTLVREELGAADTDKPAWASVNVPMTPWAGQTVRIVFEAADLDAPSMVEAAVDDVRITRP
jgi:carboxypeptidase T